MDTKLIEYLLKIHQEGNITRAAEKLFITQPALNQQLLKLEKELDTQLFNRNRNDLTPTKAGEIYLENAKKMLLIKQDTYRKLNDLAERKKGHLSVGFTAGGRGSVMFAAVYPLFHAEYPDILVTPNEMTVQQLQKQISLGEIDIAFITLTDEQKTSDNHILLLKEKIVLAVPPKHRLAPLANKVGEPLASINMQELKDEPFVVMHKKSTLREITNNIFESANITPKVLFETQNNVTIASMVSGELCCGILPYYYIKHSIVEIPCFEIEPFIEWDVVASYRKNSYLSEAGSYFISLVKEYWND